MGLGGEEWLQVRPEEGDDALQRPPVIPQTRALRPAE